MNFEVTVVVPYYNESESIEDTLYLIAKQSIPVKEVIFVNSSSTDDSFLTVNKWINKNQDKFSTKFVNVDGLAKNPGTSKNIGIKMSKTKWIAFMDCGQEFKLDWIEGQISFITSHNLDVSFGVVYLEGVNWVDRCTIAQTYGYKRIRSCVPGTLLNKKIFNITGLFLEGRRSGYDTMWRSLVREKIEKYDKNSQSIIKYKGVNFSNSLWNLYKKSILYSRTSLGIKGYQSPYYYFLFLLSIVVAFFYIHKLLIFILVFYVILRVYFLPIYRSKSVAIYKKYPIGSIFGFPITSVIIDLGKLTGYLLGMYDYLVKDLFKNKLLPK